MKFEGAAVYLNIQCKNCSHQYNPQRSLECPKCGTENSYSKQTTFNSDYNNEIKGELEKKTKSYQSSRVQERPQDKKKSSISKVFLGIGIALLVLLRISYVAHRIEIRNTNKRELEKLEQQRENFVFPTTSTIDIYEELYKSTGITIHSSESNTTYEYSNQPIQLKGFQVDVLQSGILNNIELSSFSESDERIAFVDVRIAITDAMLLDKTVLRPFYLTTIDGKVYQTINISEKLKNQSENDKVIDFKNLKMKNEITGRIYFIIKNDEYCFMLAVPESLDEETVGSRIIAFPK